MDRLIDADRLKEVFSRNVANGDAFNQLIDMQPTVDAVPVRHGEWIQLEFKSIWNNKLIVCSECGELFLVQHVESEHYCRNCGAKMDAQEKDDDRKID